MIEHNNSIVLVSSYNTFLSKTNEISEFFNAPENFKRNLILFHHLPIMDYTPIKKIPTENVILIYKKDFLPILNLLKNDIKNTLNNYTFTYLVHYNTDPESFKYTSKIANFIPSQIKISDNIQHKKNFPIIILDSPSYLSKVSEYLQKIKTESPTLT